MCRRILGCFFFLVVLCALAIGFLYYDLTRRDAGSPAQVKEPPPTPAETRAAKQTLKRLSDQARASARPAAPGKPTTITVRLTEEEANQLLHSLPEVRQSLEKARVGAPRIRFQDGRVHASARLPLTETVSARISAVGRVGLNKGELAYETEGVYLGSIPAPKQVRDALTKQMDDALAQFRKDFRGTLQEVRVEDGALTVRASR